MRPEDIRALLRVRPFRPFRFYMSDGGPPVEVRHPELALVGRSLVVVGTRADSTESPFFDDLVHCDLLHITRAEYLDGTAVNLQ